MDSPCGPNTLLNAVNHFRCLGRGWIPFNRFKSQVILMYCDRSGQCGTFDVVRFVVCFGVIYELFSPMRLDDIY